MNLAISKSLLRIVFHENDIQKTLQNGQACTTEKLKSLR